MKLCISIFAIQFQISDQIFCNSKIAVQPHPTHRTIPFFLTYESGQCTGFAKVMLATCDHGTFKSITANVTRKRKFILRAAAVAVAPPRTATATAAAAAAATTAVETFDVQQRS